MFTNGKLLQHPVPSQLLREGEEHIHTQAEVIKGCSPNLPKLFLTGFAEVLRAVGLQLVRWERRQEGDPQRMASQSGVGSQRRVHLPIFSMLAHAAEMVPERGLRSDRLGLKYSR